MSNFDFETDLYTTLNTGKVLGEGVYNGISPPNTNNTIIYSYVSGGRDNHATLNTYTLFYMVKGVAKSLASARAIAEEIDTILHGNTAFYSGGTIALAMATETVSYEEVLETEVSPLYHRGHIYRFIINIP